MQKFIYQEARKELTENDKTALGALSFFVPSTTFEAWMEVAELTRNALETTIDRLSALSLVDILAGEERYSLHPLTRVFVRDVLLADENTAHKTGMKFAEYWVDYAERYGGWEKESYKTYDRLEAEWMNLDTAANWLWMTANVRGESVGSRDAARKLSELVRALQKFLLFHSSFDERIQLYSYAYETDCATQNWRWAGWRAYDVALTYLIYDHTEDATIWADRCAEVWEREGSKDEQAGAKRLRGFVARQRKDYSEELRLFQEVLSGFRDLAVDRVVLFLLIDLGQTSKMSGNYSAAKEYYEEALEIDKKLEDKEAHIALYYGLGSLAISMKQPTDARKWFEQEFVLAKEVGRQDMIAQVQYDLALLEEEEGHVDLALPLAQDALKITSDYNTRIWRKCEFLSRD